MFKDIRRRVHRGKTPCCQADGATIKMYWGVKEHVRGSVLLSGSTSDEYLAIGPDITQVPVQAGTRFAGFPCQPCLDFEDEADNALLQRLLADVIATGYYEKYEWRKEAA